jgi:outer membrane protein OmpA-like peptidoglycan-associated protein
MNTAKHRLLHAAGSILLAGVMATSISARADQQGYLKDSAGEPLLAGGGGCVHTGRWRDSMPTCPEPTLVVEEGQAMIVFAADDSEFFGFDQVKLSERVKMDLDTLVSAVQDADMIDSITITGHADRIGPKLYNEKLALRRAEVVKAYLIAKGIPANRIQALSDGDSVPLVNCPSIKNEDKLIRCLAPNRRVDIVATLADKVDISKVTIIPPAD